MGPYASETGGKASTYNPHQEFNIPKNGHVAYARRCSVRYTAAG